MNHDGETKNIDANTEDLRLDLARSDRPDRADDSGGRLDLGAWSMAANLLIASTKAGLVLWFFMHLKYEKPLLKLLILVPIATITIIIRLTFVDIWYR